ncbi:flagellar hook-basal body protein [Alkalibacterium olivapovliticus]|uniref:Flagellar basal-body rod protein FlgG n=1 Tax=Alkalibacterium olivapovliticus TaxID=99907 RepID=A0A2T0VYW9_9LACT|nr:flagellar hook-basal body protein [Alkalibacterium olivapovliticus]PRY77521.1 flagellar basal-body rod protein FlgG [Alkalibacterium olivapovliticus]
MTIPYSISKSALQTHQHKLNHISHNISNVNTTGFKKKDVQFTELIHNVVTEQDVRLLEGADDMSLNAGVKLASSKDSFSQGALNQTGDPLHLAISGNGFFGIRNTDNELYLTRDGAFHMNSIGQIVNDRGDPLDIEITIPTDQWDNDSLVISKSGDVLSQINGQETVVGSIPVYLPPHSAAIESTGGNSYPVAEGTELLVTDANVMSGYLEESTVDLAQSLMEMIMSQRAYSLNSKVMQSTDEMYSLINQFT